MHQSLAVPVSCEDGNYYGPTDKCMQPQYGLNSQHTAMCSLPSDFGFSVGIGDFGRCNVSHGETKNRSRKAEHKEYEEKLAHDLVLASRLFFEKSSCNLYDLSSTAVNTSGLYSNTFEHCCSSYDDAMFNDTYKPECNAIPVVVEDVNAELKTDAARASHEFRLFVTDDGSTSLSEECIPLVVEVAESRANSFDSRMVSDVIPTVVENLIDDCCKSGKPVVSTPSLPANLSGFGGETNEMPHATSNLLSLRSHTDRLIFGNVGDQRDTILPSCVVEIGINDSSANGCPTDGGSFGCDRGWMTPAQCVDGGDLPTVLNFVESLPVHASREFGADFSCAFQSIRSATQTPLMDISWMEQDVPAAQPLVAPSRDCSPFLQHWHHQPTPAMQLKWSDTKRRNNPARRLDKCHERVAAGSPKRRRPTFCRREPEWAPFPSATAQAAPSAILCTSASLLSPWQAPSRASMSYRAADLTGHAAGIQNGNVTSSGDISTPFFLAR